jgi:hypothetical protein
LFGQLHALAGAPWSPAQFLQDLTATGDRQRVAASFDRYALLLAA